MTVLENAARITSAKPRHTWQRRKHARPEEITSAALAAFAENGYAATTMADIASRAGITKGTIYLYFPNKEELFNSLVREHIAEKLLTRIVPYEEDDRDVLTAIKERLDIITDMILTEEALALGRIITAEARTFPGMARFWHKEVIAPLLANMTSLMQRGAREGIIDTVEPEAAALLCLAPALQSLVWRSSFKFEDGDIFEPRNILGQQCAIIIHGLKDGRPKSQAMTQPAPD